MASSVRTAKKKTRPKRYTEDEKKAEVVKAMEMMFDHIQVQRDSVANMQNQILLLIDICKKEVKKSRPAEMEAAKSNLNPDRDAVITNELPVPNTHPESPNSLFGDAAVKKKRSGSPRKATWDGWDSVQAGEYSSNNFRNSNPQPDGATKSLANIDAISSEMTGISLHSFNISDDVVPKIFAEKSEPSRTTSDQEPIIPKHPAVHILASSLDSHEMLHHKNESRILRSESMSISSSGSLSRTSQPRLEQLSDRTSARIISSLTDSSDYLVPLEDHEKGFSDIPRVPSEKRTFSTLKKRLTGFSDLSSLYSMDVAGQDRKESSLLPYLLSSRRSSALSVREGPTFDGSSKSSKGNPQLTGGSSAEGESLYAGLATGSPEVMGQSLLGGDLMRPTLSRSESFKRQGSRLKSLHGNSQLGMQSVNAADVAKLSKEAEENNQKLPTKQAEPSMSCHIKGIHPEGLIYQTWLTLVSLPYLYTLFFLTTYSSFSDGVSTAVSYELTTIFVIDTIINMMTLHLDKDGNALSFLRSAKRNMFSWGFLIDSVTMLPWKVIAIAINGQYGWSLDGAGLDMIRLFRMVRLPRIFRVPFYRTVARTFRKITGVGVNAMAIITFLFNMIVFLHLHACFIFFFGRLAHFHDPAWITVRPEMMSLDEKYSLGIWMSVANTFIVSFKSWRPDTILSRWGEVFFIMIGAFLSAGITGVISEVLIGAGSPKSKFIQRMDQINEYIVARNLDLTQLSRQLRQSFYFRYEGKIFDEDQILSELNPWLRQEILLFGCEDILKKVPFFQRKIADGRNDLLYRTIATHLDRKSFLPGECICEQGDSGEEMFFLIEGRVSISVNGEFVAVFDSGSYFGELSMVAHVARTSTVTAMTGCQCRVLRRQELMKIVADFPDLSELLLDHYASRMAQFVSRIQRDSETG
ncbi:anaphase-promoting complex subunit Hcn1 [Chytriomyces hyalinus]|nr:anaphase-promoting complex subunit Hcn1 [Chytriomyces hyalinus]